jgi:hypothetical protein
LTPCIINLLPERVFIVSPRYDYPFIRKLKPYFVISKETHEKIYLIVNKFEENVITLLITHKGNENFMPGDYNHRLNDVELLDDVIKRN